MPGTFRDSNFCNRGWANGNTRFLIVSTRMAGTLGKKLFPKGANTSKNM